MEHLSKQQIVLLAILISFVTSLATGIITVSLMDQAPQGIARTITQVIEKTVATVPTGATSTAAVSIAVSDQVADATDKVMPSLVRLRDGDQGPIAGLGLIVSGSGAIMADKGVIDQLNSPQAVLGNGSSVPIAVTRFQIDGSVAFLSPLRTVSIEMRPIALGGDPRLGSSVWTLTGTSSYALSQGIVTKLDQAPDGSLSLIETSIQMDGLLPGAPLFDATGSVIGIATDPSPNRQTVSFYPASLVASGIPK